MQLVGAARSHNISPQAAPQSKMDIPATDRRAILPLPSRPPMLPPRTRPPPAPQGGSTPPPPLPPKPMVLGKPLPPLPATEYGGGRSMSCPLHDPPSQPSRNFSPPANIEPSASLLLRKTLLVESTRSQNVYHHTGGRNSSDKEIFCVEGSGHRRERRRKSSSRSRTRSGKSPGTITVRDETCVVVQPRPFNSHSLGQKTGIFSQSNTVASANDYVDDEVARRRSPNNGQDSHEKKSRTRRKSRNSPSTIASTPSTNGSRPLPTRSGNGAPPSLSSHACTCNFEHLDLVTFVSSDHDRKCTCGSSHDDSADSVHKKMASSAIFSSSHASEALPSTPPPQGVVLGQPSGNNALHRLSSSLHHLQHVHTLETSPKEGRSTPSCFQDRALCSPIVMCPTGITSKNSGFRAKLNKLGKLFRRSSKKDSSTPVTPDPTNNNNDLSGFDQDWVKNKISLAGNESQLKTPQLYSSKRRRSGGSLGKPLAHSKSTHGQLNSTSEKAPQSVATSQRHHRHRSSSPPLSSRRFSPIHLRTPRSTPAPQCPCRCCEAAAACTCPCTCAASLINGPVQVVGEDATERRHRHRHNHSCHRKTPDEEKIRQSLHPSTPTCEPGHTPRSRSTTLGSRPSTASPHMPSEQGESAGSVTPSSHRHHHHHHRRRSHSSHSSHHHQVSGEGVGVSNGGTGARSRRSSSGLTNAQSSAGHYRSSSRQEEENKRITFLQNMSELKKMGWYWGPLSFEEAELLLKERRDGTFLVRDSAHEAYILSLSFRARGHTYHTRIEHSAGRFSFWSQPESHSAATIVEFIEKAVEHSKNGKFHYFLQTSVHGQPPIQVSLLHPLSRFQVVQSLKHLCRFEILRHVRRDHIGLLILPPSIRDYLGQKQYYAEFLADFAEETRDHQPLDFVPASGNEDAPDLEVYISQRSVTLNRETPSDMVVVGGGRRTLVASTNEHARRHDDDDMVWV